MRDTERFYDSKNTSVVPTTRVSPRESKKFHFSPDNGHRIEQHRPSKIAIETGKSVNTEEYATTHMMIGPTIEKLPEV